MDQFTIPLHTHTKSDVVVLCNKCGRGGPVMYEYGPGRHLCPDCAVPQAERENFMLHDMDTRPAIDLDNYVRVERARIADVLRRYMSASGCEEHEAIEYEIRALDPSVLEGPEPPPILFAALPEPGPRPDVTPPESDARRVIRERCADWSRRSDKWHGILDLARRWVAFGDKAPTVIGAIVACLAWQYPGHYAGAFPLAGAVVCALVGWRARAARGDLDDAHTEQCWLIADRMSEFYRGLIAQFGSADDQILLSKSQIVEATARIGLPDNVRDAIACVVKVS